MPRYLRSALHRRSIRMTLLAAAVLALAGSSLALADEHEPPPPAPEEEPASTEPAPVEERPEDGVIVFSLPDENGEFADCSGVELGDEAGEAAAEGEEAPLEEDPTPLTPDENGCYVVPSIGPNDQRNHGQAVRAYVHAIKSLEFDGPRGHLVREAAKSGIGKGDTEEGDGESFESEETSTDGHPGRGNGKGKGKGRP